MPLSRGNLLQPQQITQVQIDSITPTAFDEGLIVWNSDSRHMQIWDGVKWKIYAEAGATINATQITGSIPFSQITGNVPGGRLDAPIDGALLVDSTVTDAKIVGLNGSKLAASSVGDAKIIGLNGSKVVDGTVTDAKLDTVKGSRLIGDIDGGLY